jgi:uncharacterized RDD family membrane protein YckC
LSTSAAIQAELAPTWKLEVNRRLAAHRSRKESCDAEPETNTELHSVVSSRAAQAAARVAARYAKAPSYSELLAADARAAVRAAAVASRAAQQAQVAAETVLAGLQAGLDAESAAKPADHQPVRPSAAPSSPAPKKQSYAIRWEPDMPVRTRQPGPTRATHGPDLFEIPVEKWQGSESAEQDAQGAEEIRVVEPARPIHANLLEFPRELVATRKVRPRLAEGPYADAAEPTGQLSIFEVEPGSISTQPAAESAAKESAAWPGQVWSGIELEEEPREESAHNTEKLEDAEGAAGTEEETPAAPALELAPFTFRFMAAAVDGALMMATFLVASYMAVSHARALPSIHALEFTAAGLFGGVAVLYLVLFSALASVTPGMMYARLSLCTFDDQVPTFRQRCGRLGALLFSLFPVGLGVAWGIFDEEHLSWHDRLSRTYLRRG